MINYAAIFRMVLFSGAALFLLAFAASVFHEALEQRAQFAEAARCSHSTNAIPLQAGWGHQNMKDGELSAGAAVMP